MRTRKTRKPKTAKRATPRRPLYITANFLRARGACHYAREEFEQTFGQRAAITVGNVRKVRDVQDSGGYMSLNWIGTELGASHEQVCTSCYPQLADADIARVLRAAGRRYFQSHRRHAT